MGGALGKIEICGVNTSKLPLLKAAEKEALFARIKKGDEEARQEYIKGNLRLVLSVIKRFPSTGENAGRSVSDWLRGAHQGYRQL